MGMTIKILNQEEFDDWVIYHPDFDYIKQLHIPQKDKYRWTTNSSYWGYENETTYAQQIMFIGKTGYGKSTTLNKLVGKEVFDTDDVSVCTKDLYTSMFRIDSTIPSFLMISDLPGVGEANYADNHYFEWYKEMLEVSNVVVYVLRADQRDLAVDEHIIKSMFSSPQSKRKLIIAINYADKIEPVNRKMGLSQNQILNLKKRISEVSRIFNFPEKDILYYSAKDDIGIKLLEKKIARKLRYNYNL